MLAAARLRGTPPIHSASQQLPSSPHSSSWKNDCLLACRIGVWQAYPPTPYNRRESHETHPIQSNPIQSQKRSHHLSTSNPPAKVSEVVVGGLSVCQGAVVVGMMGRGHGRHQAWEQQQRQRQGCGRFECCASIRPRRTAALGAGARWTRPSSCPQSIDHPMFSDQSPPTPPPPHNQMGRMHSGGKGMASSALPYKRTPPSWAKSSPKDVEEHVCKLAKKGLTPSQVRPRRMGGGDGDESVGRRKRESFKPPVGNAADLASTARTTNNTDRRDPARRTRGPPGALHHGLQGAPPPEEEQ